ncbi:MAG: EthD domain-containing protein [Halioglobus sp.]
MIKMNFCVRKRDDISEEEFHDYWLNKHGPLVKSHRESLCVKKYTQSHAGFTELDESVTSQRGMKTGYDGLAELWWENVDTLQSALETKDGRQAGAELLEDEARFIDLAKSTIFFSEEHVIFE